MRNTFIHMHGIIMIILSGDIYYFAVGEHKIHSHEENSVFVINRVQI